MNLRSNLYLVGIGWLITITGIALMTSSMGVFGSFVTSIGITMALLPALYMMIKAGSTWNSSQGRMIKFSVGILLLFALLKILHLQYSIFFLVAGSVGIIAAYTLSFLKKPGKTVLDYLKLIWVLAVFIITPLRLTHYIREDFQYVPLAMFWITFLWFVFSMQRMAPVKK
jgi:hypothetical protein